MSNVNINAYTDFVVGQRFLKVNDDVNLDTSANYLDGEHLEFLFQHEHSELLMLPMEVMRNSTEELRHAKDKMADEMGDCLWFCFDAAVRAGIDPSSACQVALNSHGVQEVEPLQTIDDIEVAAVKHAPSITVLTKAGLLFGETGSLPADACQRSLHDGPGYVFLRVMNRLTRSLRTDDRLGGPPVASDLEPRQNLEVAMGEYLLTAAYIARTILGVPLKEIAEFNKVKLRHRKQYGKEYDIQFSDYMNDKRLQEN